MSTPQTGISPEKVWVAALVGSKVSPKPTDPLKDLDVDEIRGAMTFSMEKIPQGALDHLKGLVGKNTMSSLDKKGNAMNEIDTQEDNPNLKSLDTKTMKAASEALKKITAIKDKALAAKFDEAGYSGEKLEKMQAALEAFQNGEPLPKGSPSEKEIKEFEKLADKIDGEVADEVFTPLVRQGAMPENLVPDRYSNMKRTFEGAKKGYEERLQKYTEEAGEGSELIRKLGISQNVIEKASNLGSAILKALPPPVDGSVVEHVDTAVKLLPLASGMVIETAKQLAQKKDPQDIINSILGNVSSICSTALGDEHKDIAEIVSGSITAAIAGGKMVRSIIDKNPQAAFESLAAAVSAALTTAATAEGQPELKNLAPAVIGAIVTGAKAKRYRDALKKGDDKEIKEALAELLESSIETIANATKGVVSEVQPDEDEADSINELVESAADGAKEAQEALLGDDEEEEEGVSDEDKEQLLELKKSIKEQDEIIENKSTTPEKRREACKKKAEAILELQENRQMIKKLKEADDPEFLDISQDDVDDSDDDATPPKKLQELILQLQKDQKIFKLINTLSSLPLQIAAEFFPPAGAALNFKQFAFEVFIAVKHARALLVWQDNAKNAKWGASPQVHAMLSRVGMSERRATEHSINAALYLTAGIGNIVTTVGAHGAPVGMAMTAGAKVGLAAAALAKVAIDEAEMEKGWRLFQAALKDPKNRKAARRAIEDNPTLAKYSLAWGAIEGGDVFAKDALKKCGITPRILETEGANVQEVQRYLETMFDEDLIILRAVPVKKAWYPNKKPVLTFVSWTAFLGAATTKAKPPLAKGSGGAVSEAFVNYNTAEKTFKAATKEYDRAKAEMDKIVSTEMGKLPKRDPRKRGQIVAPKTVAQIQQDAIDQSKIEDAKKNLEESKKGFLAAVAEIKSAASGFAPLNETDKKEHVEMREYLDALEALGDLKLRELGGDAVALDMTDDEEQVEGEDEDK
ncbi:MAG TPA: hypothetical protein VHW09_24280 [Bryobacteraceae bacterium]|jgi:hypothetical protein|nr:hypothetical protein [Bryobacteraceae bacterium]